jgi:hypothetical protein
VVAFTVALQAAKEGKFEYIPRLLEAYDPEREDPLNRQCMVLLGDAGPASCFAPLIRELETKKDLLDYQVVIHYCEALSIRGKLADIPVQLAAFEAHADVPDTSIIPVLIARSLEKRPGPLVKASQWPSLNAYRDAVLARYRELADNLGGDQVLVFKGEPDGVIRLAKYVLDALKEPFFQGDFRRKFEAATGIDCSGFYQNEVLQPLAAAEIVEEFLESPAAEKYEQGVRYFFGHRIPD